MSRDVSKTGGGVIVVPKISPDLRKLLNQREVVASYGGDAGTDGGGEFRRGPWIKPDWVDIRERDEARAALPSYEHLAGQPPRQVMIDFLNFLWISTKHSSDQTFEGICLVYPRMLQQFPAYCWRPEKLDLAPHAFPTWFPTVGEIAAFLMPDKVFIEEEMAGLRGVAEANINSNARPASARPGQRPWAEGGAEDHAQYLRDKADRERRELAAVLAERDAAQGKFTADDAQPVRQAGETDKQFVARLMEHSRRQISLGEAALRRDNRMRAAAIKAETKASYDATGIKVPPKPEAQTADETAQNTMSCGDGA